jgi:serine/threonine-protein kinase
MAQFLDELKRRHVVKVGAAYAAAAWLLAQIVETVFPVFDLPGSILRAVFIVLGLGFPVTLVLAWVYDLTPEGIQRTDDIPESARGRRLTGRGLDFTIIGCLSIAVLFLIVDRHFSEPEAGESVPSIAVLQFDFEQIADDPEMAYLGDGITDSLIMRLSRIPGLKVKSRSLIDDSNEDVQSIGRLLGVDALCMGRMTQRGDALEIIVELVDVLDGTVMWTNRLQHNVANLISIESEVSAEIAQALKVELSADEEEALARSPTDNPAAYRLYLQGRYFWNQRGEQGLRRSADFYRRAVDLDPDYALAWSGLGDAYLMLYGWGFEPPREIAPLVLAAVNRAIELDPTLAEPHATLGYFKTIFEWDWDGAREAFLTAIQLNDNYSTAHHWYAFFLSTIGDSNGAVEQILKARDSEPLSPVINTEVSLFYIYDGQYAQAIEELRAAEAFSADYPLLQNSLMRAYALDGQIDTAREIHQQGASGFGDNIVGLGFGNMVLPKIGLRDEAKQAYGFALKASETRYVMPAALGVLAAAIGDYDAAFAHFEQALEEGAFVLSWLRDPLIADIRDDSRYEEIFERVGLTH